VGKTSEALALNGGDTVEFNARIDDYEKGYVNWRQGIDDRRRDYKLSRPTKSAMIQNRESANA
jgi:hypothetical protein